MNIGRAGTHVTNDEAGAGRVLKTDHGGKAAVQDHHRRHHRGLTHVTNDEAGAGRVLKTDHGGKAAVQDHHRRHHRGLRDQPHDLLLPFSDWICQVEGSKALLGRKIYETWQPGLISLYDSIRENRVFVEGVYRSIQRDKIENYLFQVVYGLLYDVVHQLSTGYSISQEDQQYITHFYKYAFVGVTLDWVKGGMKEPPEEVVGRTAPSPSDGESR